MANYHLRDSGPAVCKADKRSCPLKNEDNSQVFHGSFEEVSHKFAQTMEDKYGSIATVSKNNEAQEYPFYENEDEQEYWETIRRDIGTIVIDGEELAVQPHDENSSCRYCISCNYIMRKDDEFIKTGKGPCFNCKSSLKDALFVGTLLSRDALNFIDKDEVLKSKWYHSSTHANWGDYVKNLSETDYVHMGTEQSALDRMNVLSRAADAITYIYEIELLENSSMDDKVHFEDPADEYNIHKINSSITRYVNEMEDPGSISLAVSPKNFKITNKTIAKS